MQLVRSNGFSKPMIYDLKRALNDATKEVYRSSSAQLNLTHGNMYDFPKVSVEKNDNHGVYKLEIPGVDKEDVHVSCKGKEVKIHWSRDGTEFDKVFYISEDFDPSTLTAKLDKGILYLTVNNAPDNIYREIPIDG